MLLKEGQGLRPRIEAAFTASRDGGNARSAAVYEAQLPRARALAEKLAKRRGGIAPQRLIAGGPTAMTSL
ncbi:MAG: hypothetical protein WBF43_14530 [Methylocella sp.]